MIRKIVYIGVYLALAVIAVLVSARLLAPLLASQVFLFYLVVALIGATVFLVARFAVDPLIRRTENNLQKAATDLSSMAAPEIFCVALGIIIGLIIGSLLGVAVARIDLIGTYLAIIIALVMGYMGFLVGYQKRKDFASIVTNARAGWAERAERSEKEKKDKKKHEWNLPPKILDTSVIIDGRISDIYRTGFLEGELIVPQFVLEELQHIADSGDSLKRNRGRGGLDCLKAMQNEFGSAIVIRDKNYPDIPEVDSKLLRLAQDMQGAVVTNDFNLNKVAQLQGVPVLNINELSNAVKPVVLPGEEMSVQIVREGREASQGVGYLDDGTMIVVENGRNYIDHRLRVVVTSILQTAAGRMVFVRPKLDRSGKAIETTEQIVPGKGE